MRSNKVVLKRKRVTVTMQPDLYAEFHRFAELRGLSDDRAGSVLINACFRANVYEILNAMEQKGTK